MPANYPGATFPEPSERRLAGRYQWLIERRVERAKDLMTNTRLPLAHIATQSGFADQSALNRSFKRIHGVTPGIWRRTTT